MQQKTCSECIHCTRKNSITQRGLCIEEHAPRNTMGEPHRLVNLWSVQCWYFAETPAGKPKRKNQRKEL
ncbi:MAG TPA: hypothetical protein O0X40_02325 [Methanocorpusculum sp.]|nr:hypothetical protein [Methanocorpusculum sp.]